MLLLVVADSLALSCAPPTWSSNVPFGTVPANAELVVFHGWVPDQPPVFLGPTGEPVAFSLGPAALRAATVDLDEPLVPGATYTLAGAAFVVSSMHDVEAPNAPFDLRVERVDIVDDLPVGLGEVHRLDIDLTLDEPDSWAEVEVATQRDFSDAVRFAAGGSTSVGTSACGFTWTEYDPNIRYVVRARQVDLAGNRSGWAVPFSSSGCSTSSTPLTGWALLVALVGLRRCKRD